MAPRPPGRRLHLPHTDHHAFNSFFSGLGRFVVRFRWLILALWILGTIAVASSLPSLGSQVNNDNSAFLPANSPSIRASNMLDPILGKESFTDDITIVAYRQGSPLTAADQAVISQVTAAAGHVPNVKAVVQTATSVSGEAAQLSVRASIDNFGPQQGTDMVNDLTRVTQWVAEPSSLPASTVGQALHNTGKLPAQVATATGLHFYVAGPLATDVANNNQSNSSAKSLSSLSILLILVLLFLIFRSVLAPFVALFPAVMVLVVAGGVVGALGEAGLQVSEFTQILMIVLLLGAGTDYGLFLIFRVREELWAGREPKEAVAVALSRVGESISASAGTVIVALLTLMLASFGIYKDLGAPLAIAIAIMLLAGLTFLPALLAILGRAVFWPSKIRPGDARNTLWGRAAGKLVRRPAITLIIGVIVFGALAAAVSGFHAGGFGGAENAPAGTNVAAGNAVIEHQFPHSTSDPTEIVFRYSQSVWSDPAVLTSAERVLSASPLITTVQGPLDPTGQAITPSQLVNLHAQLGPAKKLPPSNGSIDYNIYRATAQYLSANGRTVAFAVGLKAGNPEGTAALNAVPGLRTLATRAGHTSGAVETGVAGEAPGLYDVSSTSTHDLTHIVPLAILAIALLLALVLRSLIAPLYLIASVVLSYLAAMGLAVLVFIEWRGDGGLTFLLPFLMFIFLLALGEDYNILVMTRIREEAHDLPLKEAVIRAVGATGPTVTSAGLVLAGTFAMIAVTAGSSPGSSQIVAIGFGLACGILMDTFLVRTVLVPATVSLLGRWNWWPSRLARDESVTLPPGEPEVDADLEPAR